MAAQPKVLLVSLRDPDDPMCEHERGCFARAARLPVDTIDLHVVTAAPVTAAQITAHDAFFFGGSGAYSVLDRTPWMPDAVDALKRVIDVRKPAWASCFGFQALAKALDGEVIHDEALTEMGGMPLTLTAEGNADPLMSTLPPTFWVQQGHHDHVIRLPSGVVRLAQGNHGVEQAFRVDGTPFYASQFHPELDVDAVIDRFLYYREHYHDGDEDEFEIVLAQLRGCQESPEVGELLALLVRGGWA